MAVLSLASRRRTEQDNPDLAVIRQLDELTRLASEERDKQLGNGFFSELRRFFSLDSAATAWTSPNFRPKVQIPELQVMLLNEATDISDASPRIFLLNGGKRDERRETAFQEHWRQMHFNNRLLEVDIWALFAGTGFAQVGFDPDARRGRGEVWIASRDPDTVYVDPASRDPKHWVYLQFVDTMYLDEVRRRWPEKGYLIQPRRGATFSLGTSEVNPSFRLTTGPMRYASSYGGSRQIEPNPIVNVRHTFIHDYTTEEISKEERERMAELLGPLVTVPKYKPKWPNGRYLIDCEEIILADGENPYPLGRFPIIPFHGMPSLGSFWAPPGIRYTRGLQFLAERMLTQTFENAVRLNNGVWFIHEDTGITADDFGGIPAEIRVINRGSQFPDVKWPQPMPQHMTQIPQLLLDKQKELLGFSGARGGQQGNGNIGPDLMDASIIESSRLTRLRMRILSESVQDLAEMVFYTMARYYNDYRFPRFDNGRNEPDLITWSSIATTYDNYDVYLDPASVYAVSASAMRRLVLALLDKGHLPLKFALEMLDIPGADEMAEAQEQSMQLAALTKLKRPR
jgi:hypothetical protein